MLDACIGTPYNTRYSNLLFGVIDPAPDTVIRVFMAWYGTKKPVKITEQKLSAPERVGFTVVEWGGSEIR